MKKKKAIVIKNPRLRKIRENLRLLLGEAVWKEIHQWRDKFNKAWEEYMCDPTPEKERIAREFQDKENFFLFDVYKGSICCCVVCGRADKDMTYNAVMKEWYCVDCYQSNKNFYKSDLFGSGEDED